MEWKGILLSGYEAFGVVNNDGSFGQLGTLFKDIGNAGWHLIGRVGVLLALIDILLVAAMIFFGGNNPRRLSEAKGRMGKVIIVSAILINLVVIVSIIEKAAGLDY